MDPASLIILFVIGIAIGSFLNVLALRYDGDHFVFDPRVIGGRSHCPHCGKTLRWYELIPLASFAAQGGKCRHCGARIGWNYPFIELLSGLIFALVPLRLGGNPLLSVFWIAAFEVLLLITYIDIRLQIVPDELDVALTAIAIFAAIFFVGSFGPMNQSFLTSYAAPFGLQESFWLNHLLAAFAGGGFFALLIGLTRGHGMGWGDVKLALPLGFLFGWPDVLFLLAAAFISGAAVGAVLLVRRKKTMKSALPFVPFLAFGSAFVFFFGTSLLGWYFRIIGL